MRTLVDAGPDAIQPSPARLRCSRSWPVLTSPRSCCAPTSRTCTARASEHALERAIEDAAARALRLDAACVVVNLLSLPGEPELYRQCVRNVSKLRAVSEPLGLPVMVEPWR